MRNYTSAPEHPPSIAHDLRALAEIYGAVFSMWAERLRRRRPVRRFYGPIEVIRPPEALWERTQR